MSISPDISLSMSTVYGGLNYSLLSNALGSNLASLNSMTFLKSCICLRIIRPVNLETLESHDI